MKKRLKGLLALHLAICMALLGSLTTKAAGNVYVFDGSGIEGNPASLGYGDTLSSGVSGGFVVLREDTGAVLTTGDPMNTGDGTYHWDGSGILQKDNDYSYFGSYMIPQLPGYSGFQFARADTSAYYHIADGNPVYFLYLTPIPIPGYNEDYETTYLIRSSAEEGGKIFPKGPVRIVEGDDRHYQITPAEGYVISDVLVDGESIGAVSEYIFENVREEHTIKAVFEKQTDHRNCPKDDTCLLGDYEDTDPNAWYHDGVHYGLKNELMVGIGNGEFGPNVGTSRAMIAVMLWNLSGKPVVNYALDFGDVEEGQWYTEAIRWAKSEGIAIGYDNGDFGVNDPVTREQLVTILWRYAQYKGYDVSVGEDTNILSYDDAFAISEYAIPAMQWACGVGLVKGIPNANGGMDLLPAGTGDRAQTATIFMQFCENVLE